MAVRVYPTVGGVRGEEMIAVKLPWLFHWRRRPADPADSLTPEETLEVVGPSWAGMTAREREFYGISGGLTETELDQLCNATGFEEVDGGDVDDAA